MDAPPGSASPAARGGQHMWSFSMGPMQLSTVPTICEFQYRPYGLEPAKAMVVVTLLPWSWLAGRLTSFIR